MFVFDPAGRLRFQNIFCVEVFFFMALFSSQNINPARKNWILVTPHARRILAFDLENVTLSLAIVASDLFKFGDSKFLENAS